MPETATTRPPGGAASIARQFVGYVGEHARRADRALAHAIRAAQRHGVDQGAILDATGLDWVQVLECLDRWPGDVQ